MKIITRQDGLEIAKNLILKLQADGHLIALTNIDKIDFADLGRDIGHFWLSDVNKYNIVINII